jgi:hypothetical protein
MQLFAKESWKKKRDDSLDMARRVRDLLTDPNGSYAYAPNDIRVRTAVGQWVLRALKSHAIYMGRQPVINNGAVVTPTYFRRGKMYAA